MIRARCFRYLNLFCNILACTYIFQITFNWPGTLQLTYDLGTYLNVEFSALSITDVKKRGFPFKKTKLTLKKPRRSTSRSKWWSPLNSLLKFTSGMTLTFFKNILPEEISEIRGEMNEDLDSPISPTKKMLILLDLVRSNF